MREAYAITGFVSSDVAKNLAAGTKNYKGKIDVRIEQGSDELVARVDPSHVVEVRTGPSTKGETGVQLILRDKADVETVTQATISKEGILRLRDPLLVLKLRPIITSIFV